MLCTANTMHRFRMNWGAGGRRIDTGDDHSIFVGDLAPDVSDELLLSTFSSRFSSVRGAKVRDGIDMGVSLVPCR